MTRLRPVLESEIRALIAAGDREKAITRYVEVYQVSGEDAAQAVDRITQTPPPRIANPLVGWLNEYPIATSEVRALEPPLVAYIPEEIPPARLRDPRDPPEEALEPEKPEAAPPEPKGCPTCGGKLVYGRWGFRGGAFDNVYCGCLCPRCDWAAGGRPPQPPMQLLFSPPKPRWHRGAAVAGGAAIVSATWFAFVCNAPWAVSIVFGILVMATVVWLMRK